MPVALSSDTWELVKALWLQGVNPQEIHAQTGVKPGTIKARASRHGWLQLKQQAKACLVQVPNKSLAIEAAEETVDISKRMKAKANALTERALNALNKAAMDDPDALPGKNGLAATLKTVVDTADTLNQWSAERGKGLINVNILSSGGSVEVKSEE